MFVKKKAPLGRKAERKWRIADLGLELILRAKKAAAAEVDASAAEVSVLQGSEGVCSRSFVVVTHSGAAEVVRSLLRGGIALAYARLPFLLFSRGAVMKSGWCAVVAWSRRRTRALGYSASARGRGRAMRPQASRHSSYSRWKAARHRSPPGRWAAAARGSWISMKRDAASRRATPRGRSAVR